MPLTGDELVCPKFQPNIFDSTRCHDCLRQKHLHNSSPEHDTTAAHSQEKDTSTKEDSDVLSVVSSYCDVSRGGRGFEDGSLCILSADCDLYVCDGDDDQSSDSQCDDSVYSSSVSVEEGTNVLHYPSSHCRMTRLDLSSHRSNPRGWTEVGHGRDAFGSFGFSHGGVQEKRDRESGYFSLGRAAGSRAVCDKGSPPPYRHSERGHPIPGNKSPEPKATIPFRNPDLGVPSERRTSEIQNPELTDCPPQHVTPDPVDLSVEVEALAGPRSLSPTPFKQAESLSPSKRRVERNVPSSSYRQPGTLGPSQRSSSLSRSSSPDRSISPLRRGESTSSLNTLGFRAGSFAQAREQVSVSPAWNAYSGSSQKNFRSLASTVGTVSSVSKSYMDLKGTLRNSDNNSSHVGSTVNRGRSSPSRRSYDGPGQTSVRKSEMSPSSEYGHDRQSSPHAGRRYDARSQSPKGRKETDNSSGQIREGRRSASPVRKGYGTEKRSTSNGWCFNRESPPSSRKGYDTQIQPSLKKAEVKSSLHSYRRDSRHSSPSRRQHQHPDQSLLYKSKTSQVNPTRELKSRTSSPLRWGNDNPSQSLPRKSEIGQRSATLRHDPTGHAPLRNTVSDRTDSASYVKNTSKSQRESNPPLGHWRGSAHSLLSQSVSRSSSPSRNSSAPVAWETSQSVSKRSNVKQERENQSSTPNSRPSVSQKQSLSPSMQRHTSSQSSMDSESSHLSAGSSGLNREEYAVMANLPKVKTVLQREGPSHLERLKSQQRRDLSLYKPASHCQSKAPNSEWDEVEEERDAGRLSRAHSSSSLYTQRASSPSAEQIHKNPSRSSEHKQKAHRPSVYFSCSVEQTDEESVQQPDLLNFKKGWMSKLDESGEWRKHWFVLTDAGLKYYRDSAAEERDEVDGEIDLKTCVKVSEFDVEKNYGFQIQTREAVFTMSAMTAGIRRNWIEVLKKSIRPNGSPDLTQLPDCSADKDNTRHTSSHRHHSQSEVSSSTNPAHCKFDYVELSCVAPTSAPTSASQRESGEGQVREHGQWQEERSRDAAHGQWETVLSRKGAGQLTEQRRLQEEIEKKWAEFEQLPLKDMRSLPSMESRPGPLSNQALEREVASLRQQLVMLQGGREGSQVGWAGCWGAESRCIESLQQMERVHRETLEEMEKQHTQQIRALERERDVLLREETEATARVMKALQKAHKVELEKTTQHAERDGTDTQAFDKQQQAELVSLRRELEGLSERYSQKCLELNEAQQHSKERERHINLRDRQLEQFNRDNQELQVRLSEEIKVIGSVVRRQGSDADSSESSWCETQVLLRVRENELQYLHKELSCLRSQLHLLTTEKNSVCEQYREVCEELSLMKNRSESEIETLREHLRLALNALQDGQHTHNSLQH